MALSAELQRSLAFALGPNGLVLAQELIDAINAEQALASGKIIVGSAGGVATDVDMSGDVTIGNTGITAIGAGKVTLAMILAASLDGTIAKVVANANLIGGIPVLHRVAIADASADTDTVLTHKTRVTRFDFLNTGIAAHAANDTVQLKNVATAITDAVAKTATVNRLVTALTYDPAQVEIAAGAIMRITAVKDTNVAGVAYVYGVRVA